MNIYDTPNRNMKMSNYTYRQTIKSWSLRQQKRSAEDDVAPDRAKDKNKGWGRKQLLGIKFCVHDLKNLYTKYAYGLRVMNLHSNVLFFYLW